MSQKDRRGRAHLESELEAFFVKRVRMLGGRAFKFVPLVAGVPDRIVFWPDGRTFLVELKQEGEKPEPIQEVWHSRFAAMGHPVVVIDTRAGVLEWLRKVVDSSPLDSKSTLRRAAR